MFLTCNKYDLFDLGMVHRSKRVVQWYLRLQYVFGTAFPISIPFYNIAVYVVYRSVFLSHWFCYGSRTEWNWRIHYYQHHWSYKYCRNGTYCSFHYIIINIFVLHRIQHNNKELEKEVALPYSRTGSIIYL